MASQIKIFNLALAHLGLNEVTSINADNPSANACREYFETSVKDALSEHRWPFATVKAPLTLTEDETLEMEWEYVYVYPVKALAVWTVYNESTVVEKELQEFETAYQIENNLKIIGSNLDSAYAEQTYYVADTEIYSPKFADVLSWRMAANMAHRLTGDVEVGLKAREIYSAVLSEAKRLSASEQRKVPKQKSSSVASR